MRFAPGQSGNPSGKPPGTRSRRALLVESLFEGDAEAVGRKAVELALAGNVDCIKLIVDRVSPARRDRPIRFRLPAGQSDAAALSDAVMRAVSRGEIAPMEAAALAPLIQVQAGLIEPEPEKSYVLNVSLKQPPLPMHAAAAPEDDYGYAAAPFSILE
jgi:Family of unknown function (DUF5681)